VNRTLAKWLMVTGGLWNAIGVWLWSYLGHEVDWPEWQEWPMTAMGVLYFAAGILMVLGSGIWLTENSPGDD